MLSHSSVAHPLTPSRCWLAGWHGRRMLFLFCSTASLPRVTVHLPCQQAVKCRLPAASTHGSQASTLASCQCLSLLSVTAVCHCCLSLLSVTAVDIDVSYLLTSCISPARTHPHTPTQPRIAGQSGWLVGWLVAGCFARGRAPAWVSIRSPARAGAPSPTERC
ncbi:hypothetical protein LX32DRAFT_399609 [Colletotrichum zoysiae]|uniref:Uncharacterized protein n=1 Tax=Colletotrichum zoysiae TaxID=1216348 RepID=A0AAD9HHP2_9PEZI|nr:hypothetical protein LX32DRAFT_399609 [Colletotrichum zoysiae]